MIGGLALHRLVVGPAEPRLVELLVRTAVNRPPHAQLRHVSPHPRRDLGQGHHLHLAAAELRRLGPRADHLTVEGGGEPAGG